MLKKLSVLGFPRGANIRCRLLLGFLRVRANSSNPMVALTRSRRMALPTVVSPEKYALSASVKSVSRKRGSRSARRYRVFELSCECHRFLRSLLRVRGVLTTTVICPPFSCRLDRLLLALFCAATLLSGLVQLIGSGRLPRREAAYRSEPPPSSPHWNKPLAAILRADAKRREVRDRKI